MQLELALVAAGALIALPLTFLLRLRTKPGRRPEHQHIPRIGGFSILAAFILAPFVVAIFIEDARTFIREDWQAFLALALCGGAVFAVGAVDDFRDLGWRIRLGVQVAAGVGLYAAGFRVGEMTLPAGGTVDLGLLDPLITIGWLVFITNALNLVDGRDGVAAGIAALVAGTMAFIAWDLGHELIAMLFAALAGASLGFIPANFPPARRFLGDGGAYFLGFTIGGLCIAGFVDSTGRVPLYIAPVALGLPVLDTLVAFLRRFLDGRHPFEADRDHLHDRMERLYRMRPVAVTLTTYAITAVFCGAALLLHAWYKNAGSAVVGAAVLAFAVVIVVALGYVHTMWNSNRVRVLRGRGQPAEESVG